MSRTPQHVFYLAAALVLFAVGTGFFLSRRHSTSFVFAQSSDDLDTELFGGTKLFDQDNMLPGDDLVGRWFKVTNKSTTADYPLYFVAWKTGGSDTSPVDFADVLNIKIEKDGGGVLYNDSLKKLFDKSSDKTSHDDLDETDGVSLNTTLAKNGGEQKFFISAAFAQSAGNEYKNKEVIWDAILGFVGGVPEPGVLAAETGGSILGIATGANLIPSILGSLAALSTGLYLRRRATRASLLK